MFTWFAIGATLLAMPFLSRTAGVFIGMISDSKRMAAGATFSQTVVGICLFTPMASVLSGLAVWLWQRALA